MKKDYEVNTDILRIGDTYYAIKRIESQNIDINAELKELYEQRHAQHISQMNDGFVAEAELDWKKQIEHIRKFDGRGSITIPTNLFGKPVMEHRGNLLELRVITYSPCQVQGTREYFTHVYDSAHIRTMPTGTIIANIKPSFSVPMLVGYCARTNKLYTPLQQTFHSFSNGKVCTGTHSASDFWCLSTPDLEREMNRINLFSPASQNIRVNGTNFRLRDMYTRDTVTTIEERGENIWSV